MSDASGTPRTDAIVNRLGATNYDFKRDMISLARELEALTISQTAEIQRLRVDVLEEAAKAVEVEHLVEFTGSADDIAYDQAISCACAVIRDLKYRGER